MFPKWMREVQHQGFNNPKPLARLLEAPGRPQPHSILMRAPRSYKNHSVSALQPGPRFKIRIQAHPPICTEWEVKAMDKQPGQQVQRPNSCGPRGQPTLGSTQLPHLGAPGSHSSAVPALLSDPPSRTADLPVFWWPAKLETRKRFTGFIFLFLSYFLFSFFWGNQPAILIMF